MNSYKEINLKELIKQVGELEVKKILSDFFCPLNPDVEKFLKYKAIDFSKQGISNTYLVFASYQDVYVLVGYYALTNKYVGINISSFKSKRTRNKIAKFMQYDSESKRYNLSIPLIGQLGKNYAHNYNYLIAGDELLKLALDKVREAQNIIGGKIVCLECEDTPALLEFYSQNGFINFGKRILNNDEYLIQMLRYMK